MNRRKFLGLTTGLTAGLITPPFSFAGVPKSDKAVVLIHLQGGISAVDFINPIPDATEAFRSTRGVAKTKSGFNIGGDFTELAKLSENYSVVRGLKGRDANHESATYEWFTSHKHVPNLGQKEPSFGSIYLRKNGTVNSDGVPYYVKLRQIRGDDASWMGVRYSGMDYGAEQVKNMQLNLPDQQFKRRLDYLNLVDSHTDLGQLGKDWTELKDQAVGIIKGKASEAFKLELEPQKVRDAYGNSRFAQDLLLARRLIERGSKIVSLTSNAGWDNHADIDTAFQRNAPGLDKPLATLIIDLKERGMLDDVLVVTVSEFSRTKINVNAGRDHNPNTNSCIMIGGGYNHGRVIGKTDKNGLQSVEGNYTPKDMGWTILDHLGIDRKYVVYDNLNRPRPLIDDEARNILTS